MKTILLLSLLLSTFTIEVSRADGGVGSGGGGTSNPAPVPQSEIIDLVQGGAAPLLITWFQRQEEIFLSASPEAQSRSVFRKVFTSSRTVYEVIRGVRITLREEEPCYDSAGNPWDGSVGSSRYEICLSPFSMAPKLNELNFEAETLALLAHEISHLLGTTEEEARAIQRRALPHFTKIDLGSVTMAIGSFAKNGFARNAFDYFLESVDNFKNKPSSFNASSAIFFDGRYWELEDKLRGFSNFLLAPLRTLERHRAYTTQVQVTRYFASSIDSAETSDGRKWYADALAHRFRTDREVSARTFMERHLVDTSGYGPEWDLVVLRRPEALSDISQGLGYLKQHLLRLQAEMTELSQLRFRTTLE